MALSTSAMKISARASFRLPVHCCSDLFHSINCARTSSNELRWLSRNSSTMGTPSCSSALRRACESEEWMRMLAVAGLTSTLLTAGLCSRRCRMAEKKCPSCRLARTLTRTLCGVRWTTRPSGRSGMELSLLARCGLHLKRHDLLALFRPGGRGLRMLSLGLHLGNEIARYLGEFTQFLACLIEHQESRTDRPLCCRPNLARNNRADHRHERRSRSSSKQSEKNLSP